MVGSDHVGESVHYDPEHQEVAPASCVQEEVLLPSCGGEGAAPSRGWGSWSEVHQEFLGLVAYFLSWQLSEILK